MSFCAILAPFATIMLVSLIIAYVLCTVLLQASPWLWWFLRSSLLRPEINFFTIIIRSNKILHCAGMDEKIHLLSAKACRPFLTCNSPGFDPSILRNSGIWGAEDGAVLNNVKRKKPQKIPLLRFSRNKMKDGTESKLATWMCLHNKKIVYMYTIDLQACQLCTHRYP